MRILVTNDDGIAAPGLSVAEEIARKLAGPDGEVWIIAPVTEQSGVAHCTSYARPFLVNALTSRRWSVEGMPADCILAAIHEIMPEPPDLVISGVNKGNNAAENVLYSGTVGAAMEAAFQGLPAIALSQYLGPKLRGNPDPFGAAREHGVTVVDKLSRLDFALDSAYPLFFNVNFPPVPVEDVTGIALVAQGRRPGVRHGTKRHDSPSGRQFLWMTGGDQSVASAPGTDAAQSLAGAVSVTPMRANLTCYDSLKQMQDVFK